MTDLWIADWVVWTQGLWLAAVVGSLVVGSLALIRGRF